MRERLMNAKPHLHSNEKKNNKTALNYFFITFSNHLHTFKFNTLRHLLRIVFIVMFIQLYSRMYLLISFPDEHESFLSN